VKIGDGFWLLRTSKRFSGFLVRSNCTLRVVLVVIGTIGLLTQHCAADQLGGSGRRRSDALSTGTAGAQYDRSACRFLFLVKKHRIFNFILLMKAPVAGWARH
jgi:hypothetical protein